MFAKGFQHPKRPSSIGIAIILGIYHINLFQQIWSNYLIVRQDNKVLVYAIF